MGTFNKVRAFIVDMDGVLWHGNQALPGLTEFFHTLNQLAIRFILATNNASHTPLQYVDKLARMGVSITPDQVLTSGTATAAYLAKRFNPAETRVFVVGEDGARQPLLERGFTLTDLYQINDSAASESNRNGADIVVCGKDESINWDKLATATLNIRAGAQFFGTNADVTLPTQRGITHGNGAILAALEAATNVKPITIGKPEPIMYQQALSLLGTDLENTIAIGDRLDTDILGAVNTGIRSILVLTGISSRQDLTNIDYQPTWVMEDIQAITKALQN